MDKYLPTLAFAAVVISLLVFSVFYFTGGRPAEVLPTLPGLSWLDKFLDTPSSLPPEDPIFGDDSGNGSGGSGGSGGDGSGGGLGDGSSASEGDLGDDVGSGHGPGDEGGDDDGDSGDGDDGGDGGDGGGDPPIDWGAGFDFPPGAVFPQEYLGDWEVYSLFGEEEARYLFLSFYPGGNLPLTRGLCQRARLARDPR